MKIRIHLNTIRLRLSQSEVNQLAKGTEIKEVLNLPAPYPSFIYSVKPMNKDNDLTISFETQHLSISLSESEIKTWANTEQVGISKNLPLPGEAMLKVLIEKDFQCLHKRQGEDETDNFPNPQA